MATVQSLGIGSGLDIGSLVSQLVAAERAPHEQRILRQETRVTTQISGLGSLKGALSAFQSALEKLKDEAGFNPLAVTVSDEDIFTATAAASAVPGTYQIEVVRLAQAHQLASAAFADGSNAVVGTGTLTITYGDTSFEVTIEEGKGTLAGIRDAINNAADNPGVRATLIHESGGTRLVLTAEDTGAEHSIRVTQSGGDGGLEQLVYDPPNATNLIEVQAAQDAHVRIAGFDHYSATNTISGAIDGLTLSLKKVSEPGTQVTLSVSYDTDGAVNRVKQFVDAYNSLQSQLASLRSYSPETGAAGPLLGDALLRSIEEQLRKDLADPVSGAVGAFSTLASIGITKTVDGKLRLDTEKLKEALSEDRRAVAALFTSENGLVDRLTDRVKAYLDQTDGSIASRDRALKNSLRDIERQKEALDLRMQAIEARYIKQFTALDTLLAQLQSTSAYLAQQLTSLQRMQT